MTALLAIENLSKNFAGLSVLSDVNFKVEKGERLALIGPNGAGKTTIFNLLSGVYEPSAGAILFEGRDISRMPSKDRIGLGMARSFQNIRLMPHLSVVENVMLGQQARTSGLMDMLRPVGRSAWRLEAEELLHDLGLDTYPGEVVATLPYGIRKKIEVVRALASRPKLLLLDEPAAGLNPTETASLREFLHGVSERGVTLLVVEHDMSFVRSLCERAVVLNFGRKIYEGLTQTVHEDQLVLEAYLGPRHATEDLAPAAGGTV
jgi:branched-chain amino acid transport system ATP-binding protein